MPSPLNIDFVRQTVRRLLKANAACVQAEAATVRLRDEQLAAIDADYSTLRAELENQFADEQSALTKNHQELRHNLVMELDGAATAIDKEFATATAEVAQLYDRDEKVASKELQESNWTAEAIFDAHKKTVSEKLDAARRLFHEHKHHIHQLRGDVAALLASWEQIPKAAPPVSAIDLKGQEPEKLIVERIAESRESFRKLKKLVAPRLLVGDRMLYVGLVASIAIAAITALTAFFGFKAGIGAILACTVGVTLVLGAGGSFLAHKLLAHRAARMVQAQCTPLHRGLAEAEALCRQGEELEVKRCNEAIAGEEQSFRKELNRAEKQNRECLSNALKRRDETGHRVVQTRETKRETLKQRREKDLGQLDTDQAARLESLYRRRNQELSQAKSKYEVNRQRITTEFATAFQQFTDSWHKDWHELKANLETIREQDAQFFPDWHGAEWSQWRPPTRVPPSMRFGQVDVHLTERPRDPGVEKPPEHVIVPALLGFPHRGATLLRAAGEGRASATQLLFALALRFLTSLPAGKVRLTIVDPVGLGENFAALMHLADHDPQLVGARIWTEPPQIEKRLADLTAHMENVIQKYLRSQYASIEEYNTQAGEVAEPYRVLVVANFPANFTTEAARRLERIAANGASCGVFTLVAHDPALPTPPDFDIADLQRASLNLLWNQGRFEWDDPDFRPHPLQPDVPQTGPALLATLNAIGAAAKDANRVEVDFSFIAPKIEKYWASDSRAGIDVPLGRAGATKRQHLQLGKGTAQHAIVAGKTGSGKSTLLHALITNLALHYGPDEIELYLIDFKKGVEFKTYATHHLPHARVVAIESEREFGLSVLQRLDAELKKRGELFRDLNVQDIKSFRDLPANNGHQKSNTRMPRIILIVDEFQEFFTEDDRVSQEAALLLDRLVRQGRAFGLHVLLGSQTLGGAYSLARSTIDQMAVRIALQCSEADAGLILSKDNNAARLLSRPGEAIYNDANGLLEGNDIFQVCWLNEDRREEYLKDIARRANESGFRPPAPPVIFEGNIPSDLTASVRLREKLDHRPTAPTREVIAWLGDAMAIKEPTAARFRRQSSSNVLILGQQSESARAMTVAMTAAALAQHPTSAAGDQPCVWILDGTPADDPHANYFSEQLSTWPGVRVVGPRGVADALRQINEEFDRRQTETTLAPAIFLFAFGLHRLRDLRKPDDDFGFSKKDGEPSPAQRFANLLREGPSTGIHSIVWCDTLVNFQRAAERSALREFEMKVLFQMSANDSSSLIDSPAASRLGVNRALLAHDEMAAPEKFRPYSLPEVEWVRDMANALASGRNTPFPRKAEIVQG